MTAIMSFRGLADHSSQSILMEGREVTTMASRNLPSIIFALGTTIPCPESFHVVDLQFFTSPIVCAIKSHLMCLRFSLFTSKGREERLGTLNVLEMLHGCLVALLESPSLLLKGHFFFRASMVKRRQPDIPDIVDHNVAFWSGHTKQTFSHEDVRQMLGNVAGFFQVLAEWEQKASEEEQRSQEHLNK